MKKAFRRSKHIDPLINVSARWRGVVNFKPQLLYPMGKIPTHPPPREKSNNLRGAHL
jgi:hypothetical protein